uniref:Uncharacterized protein n=1 Tax=Prevotella sp. GTC17262 TaxID=3236797 RepID=A0AB33JNN5_9BACT
MVQKSKLLAQTGEIILLNAENMLPKYFVIYKYLESKDCSLMQPQKEFCMQIVCIQMFANYFYSVYLVSLSGALKATDRREQQAHLKYVNSYIIEGYKALWGYNKQGRSMWGKFIKNYQLVKENDVFDNDIETITNRLKEYAESSITDKDERDLTMHYQIDKGGNPRELLKLEEITIEKEVNRYEQFGIIFRMMGNCITEILDYYLVKKKRNELMKLHPILPPLFSIDQYVWESKLAEMNVAMTRNIASQSKTFGDCKEQLLKWPNILKKIQAEYKIDLSDCYDILPTSEAMLAITYMSLDLCSTLKLYFNSSLPLERAIALSRMNIICYSIIDRVYGYTSRIGSYWERYLTKPYGEDDLPNVLLEIRDVMETCIKTNLYSNEKRLAFVHLKEENFISAIKMLYTQNPLKEIENSIAIVKVLPEIQRAIKESLAQIDKNIKKCNAMKYHWVDGYIEKFAPYKDRPGMNTIYLSLLELKKGNVIEALDIVKKMATVN